MSSAYKNKTYPLRIDNNLQKKVKKIAETEDRTISKQYERIVKFYIEYYEKKHGEIKLEEK
ncbi:MAG: hypothetical protein HFG37_08580 [Eubacterium sp.]|nr:hypothetical protein [Eubacterium sp.]